MMEVRILSGGEELLWNGWIGRWGERRHLEERALHDSKQLSDGVH